MIWILIAILFVAVISLIATTESLRESVGFLRSEVHHLETRVNCLNEALKMHTEEHNAVKTKSNES